MPLSWKDGQRKRLATATTTILTWRSSQPQNTQQHINMFQLPDSVSLQSSEHICNVPAEENWRIRPCKAGETSFL
jgi:hypothetical protein